MAYAIQRAPFPKKVDMYKRFLLALAALPGIADVHGRCDEAARVDPLPSGGGSGWAIVWVFPPPIGLLVSVPAPNPKPSIWADILLQKASDGSVNPKIRLAALDAVGDAAKVSSLGADTDRVVVGLAGIVESPAVDASIGSGETADNIRNLLRLHAVYALGKIGAASSKALPNMVGAVGKDPVLDAAIDVARNEILFANRIAPAATAKPTELPMDVKGQIQALKSSNNALVRLVAAKALGALTVDEKDSSNVRDAFIALVDTITKDADSDVRRAAIESAQTLLAKITITKTPADLVADGAATLICQLQRIEISDTSASVRLAAVKTLARLGDSADKNAVIRVLTQYSMDCDDDVVCAAKNAIRKLGAAQGAKPQQSTGK